MTKQSNMTVKGQVTIPKDVRDALGLKPGQPVEFALNDRGEAVIRKPVRNEVEYRRRRDAILAAIDSVAGKYSTGQSTDEIMAELREPLDEIPDPRPL